MLLALQYHFVLKSCVGAAVCDSWNSELRTEAGCSKGRALSSLEVGKVSSIDKE